MTAFCVINWSSETVFWIFVYLKPQNQCWRCCNNGRLRFFCLFARVCALTTDSLLFPIKSIIHKVSFNEELKQVIVRSFSRCSTVCVNKMMWKKFVSHEIVLLKLLKKSARLKEQDKRMRAEKNRGPVVKWRLRNSTNFLKWVTEWVDTVIFEV